MPELPDITIYIEALEQRVLGATLEKAEIVSPFLVRTFDPAVSEVEGRTLRSLRRLGKRIAFEFEGDVWMVLHLMIAGRLRWQPVHAKLPGKIGLAAFRFDRGTLILTEAGSKRRASLHMVRGRDGLKEHNPGGLEPLDCTLGEFAAALTKRNHTLKRALSDAKLFSGIGNAYSDEILHAARLSPVALTQRLSDEETARLFDAVRSTLEDWIERLRRDTGEEFPRDVTAFREGMAVHGRFGQPCPDCETSVQRIRYADRETNYCPRCQTGGRVLADRSLSKLLKNDWPRNVEELEQGD